MLTVRYLIFLTLLYCSASVSADTSSAKEIFRALIELNTAPSGGSDLRPTVDMLVARLQHAGFSEDDIAVVHSGEKLPNLIVRYRAREVRQKPVLMMAHLDVVEALPSDWSIAPFALTEADGYYYGRGTSDNKEGAAILIANLIRLKKEGYEPNRDLIVMLTADEETTGDGVAKILRDHRELVAAEFALNSDSGMVMERDGVASAFMMQTSEKVYVAYRFEASDPGGHSSVPRADSAISRLSRTLVALQEWRSPIDLNETTRAYFEKVAASLRDDERAVVEEVLAGTPDTEVSAALDGFPKINSMMRTTCIATLVTGGHAQNAIPQTASAEVNCRILPQSDGRIVLEAMQALAAPNDVQVTEIWPFMYSPPSPLESGPIASITAVAEELWPGIVVIPEMGTGATDGLYVRNAGIPVYGISAVISDPNDMRAHGRDERIRIDAFETATKFWYRLIKNVSR